MEEDEDFKLALLLQKQFEEEEQQRDQGILCQLSNERFPADQIYILDDCSHKFEKTGLLTYINDAITTQINVKCPVCPVAISVRDMKELLPKRPKTTQSGLGLVPTTSSKQASQRITAELKHIVATRKDSDGYSVQLVNDNLYLWDVSFFNFEKTDLIAQDLKKCVSFFIFCGFCHNTSLNLPLFLSDSEAQDAIYHAAYFLSVYLSIRAALLSRHQAALPVHDWPRDDRGQHLH